MWPLETTFDHWKVVFSWVKVRKRAPTQNPPYLLILIFWILNLHIIMCQLHESHSMFLPLVCNKLVKSPTPFFPILSIARSPKLWELFRFPTNVIYSLRDRRYIFETIQLSKWSLLMCSFRFSLSVKLLTQNGQLSIFLLDLTLGGDSSFGCSSFFPTLSKVEAA